jgi:hypothetical protein
LDFRDGQILHRVGQKLKALATGLDHQPQDRVFVESSEA